MQLLSGGEHDIDVLDLRNNTRYTGGYSEGSRTIKLFWEVLSPQMIGWTFFCTYLFYLLSPFEWIKYMVECMEHFSFIIVLYQTMH